LEVELISAFDVEVGSVVDVEAVSVLDAGVSSTFGPEGGSVLDVNATSAFGPAVVWALEAGGALVHSFEFADCALTTA
jgi:hypothetical protein